MSIKALAQHVKTLSDGTRRIFLRLEGEEIGEPIVHALSIFDNQIVLAEQVQAAEPTLKIPAIHLVQLSPSLYAPTLEGNGLN